MTLKFDQLVAEYVILSKLTTSPDEIFRGSVRERLIAEAGTDKKELDKRFNTLVSDKKTRLGNIEKYYNGYLPDRNIRMTVVAIIEDVFSKLRVTTTGKKSKWQFEEADLEQIDTAEELQKVIDNYASALSKDSILRNATEYFGLDEDATVERLNALRAFARKRKAELAKPQISESLVGKLSKGTKVTLSAHEVDELRKLLDGSK